MFKAGTKGSSGSDATSYDGARTASSIASFATSLIEDKTEPKPIVEVTSDEVFTEQCASALCLVSYLPHILDSKASGREGYLKELRAVSAKFKGKGISFVWVEAGQQEALANALEIGGAGYPAAAIIASKKLKYTPYQGAFTTDSLNTWVSQILGGRGAKLVSLAALPKIDKTAAWNGKDGVLPSEEL